MEVFPGWYERYQRSLINRYKKSDYVPLNYRLNYYQMVGVIEASFKNHYRINDVLWDQLVEADRRITRRALEHVYDYGWEGEEKLMAILRELVLEGKKPFNLDDYL